MPVAFPNRVATSPDVLVQEIEQETILLHFASGRYFSLDEVGSRMWQLLTTCDSIQDVLDQLLIEYDVNRDQLEQDLQTLLQKLTTHGLVHIRSS